MNIAFFDFDGTLIKKDSFFLFARYVSPKKTIIATILLLYYSSLRLLGIISTKTLKEKILVFYFKGKKVSEIMELAARFAVEVLPKAIQKEAIQKLDLHKTNGDKIVIVSASLDLWLKPWCLQNNYELICTCAEINEDYITGKIAGKNCKGEEKVRRITEVYKLGNYENIYVYGDSKHDYPMLRLGTHSFMNWKLIK